MRNLKRVLALVLALTMVLSFAISASAGAFTDVKDGDDYASAINLLASLEVLKGFEDGTYNSAGSYTREQFAKILYVLVNGKDDNAAMYQGTAPFPDVDAGRWSAGYITWAVNLGICNGRDDGNFWPTDVVKYAEACKMFLIAMGYSSTIYTYPYGFIDKASTLKMFDDIQGYTTFGDANRGTIAQMAYNALFAEAPRFGTYTAKEGESTQTKTKLLITGAFGVIYDYAVVTGTSNNTYGAGIYDDGQVALGSSSYDINWGEGIDIDLDATVYSYADDVDSLIGLTAKVWFKEDENALSNAKIYLIEDASKDKAYTINPFDVEEVDDSSASEVAFKDGTVTRRLKLTRYTVDDTATYAITPISWDGSNGTEIADGTKFDDKTMTYRVIDRAGNGTIDVVYEIQPDFAKITALSDSKISMSAGKLVGSNNIKSDDNTVVTLYDGAKKDDYALVYARKAVVGDNVKTVYDLVKAESVDNVKHNRASGSDKYFGGTAYKLLTNAGAVTLGDTYDLYMNANGYVAKAVLVEEEEEGNWLLVTDAYNTFNAADNLSATTVEGYLADGTSFAKSIDLDEVDTIDEIFINDRTSGDGAGWQTTGSGESATIAGKYKIFAYTLGDNGRIDSLEYLDDGVNGIDDVYDTGTVNYDGDTRTMNDRSDDDKMGVTTSSSVIFNVYTEDTKTKVAVLKDTDLPDITGETITYDQMGVDGGNLRVVVLTSTGKIGDTTDRYVLLISAAKDSVSSSKVNYALEVAGEPDMLYTKDISGEATESNLGVTEATLLPRYNEDIDGYPVIGYVKLTFDTAGKVTKITPIDETPVAAKGDVQLVSGAVSAIPSSNSIQIREVEYNTGSDDKVYLTDVDASAKGYVLASDAEFFTVDKAPYDFPGYKNTAKVNAASADSLMTSSFDKDVATEGPTSNDTAYGVDLIVKQTEDSGTKRVVAVFIYTTPVSGEPATTSAD